MFNKIRNVNINYDPGTINRACRNPLSGHWRDAIFKNGTVPTKPNQSYKNLYNTCMGAYACV